MEVALDKKDVINLIRGTQPSYALMEDPIIKQLGEYTRGFRDDWDWSHNNAFNKFEVSQLWTTYLKLKGK